jgi:DNA-binding Lrp family transcriptional regulator
MLRPRLDQTDFGLLRLLQRDAWSPVKELAATVGLAPSSVHERIKRLQAAGIVQRATVEVGLGEIGLTVESLIMLTVREHDRDEVDALIAGIAALPGVQSVHVLTGDIDLVVHVASSDVGALKAILENLASRPQIRRLNTSLILNAVYPKNIAADRVTAL